MSFVEVDSAGETKPEPFWLSESASEPALDGPIEFSVVFVPDPSGRSSPASSARRIIFIDGNEATTPFGGVDFVSKVDSGGRLQKSVVVQCRWAPCHIQLTVWSPVKLYCALGVI